MAGHIPCTDHLTQWSKVLSLKADSCSASQDLPIFYATWKFSTMFTRAHNWTLFWAS